MAEQENTMNLTEMLEAHRRERERLVWEGTFREYFELVTANARLASLSHARICDMILAEGTEKIAEGTRDEVTRYNFFSNELFGIEESIAKIVEYFKSAAQRLEVRKRILLLMGPVGGGKSTIVTLLKRGLEDWTRAEDGALYGIKDCPMHEEPLLMRIGAHVPSDPPNSPFLPPDLPPVRSRKCASWSVMIGDISKGVIPS